MRLRWLNSGPPPKTPPCRSCTATSAMRETPRGVELVVSHDASCPLVPDLIDQRIN